MKTIAVINQKGGVGKTTTSINLAAELARLKHRTLLVDLDPQGNATTGLGIDLEEGALALDDFIKGEATFEQSVFKSSDPNLDLLPSDSNLASLESFLQSHSLLRETALKSALARVDYDYVVIDCPPSLGLLNVNALAASSDVLIPVQAEYFALEGLGQLLGLIQRSKDSINADLNILGLLLTMYDKRTTLASDVEAQLKHHFGDKLLKTKIPRNIRLAEAPSHGLPIYKYDKWSKGARAYKALAKEVEAQNG